jgi:hypothetical protein
METECVGCQSLHAGIIQRAITKSGLVWALPLAQIMSLQMLSHIAIEDKKYEVPAVELLEHFAKSSTLMGITVEVDKTLPNDVIELRLCSYVLYRVRALAVPVGFD